MLSLKKIPFHLLYELKSRGPISITTMHPEDPIVLVLSDSPLIRRLLFLMLERERYRTLVATWIEVAKGMLRRHPTTYARYVVYPRDASLSFG